ncbi:hypothetical protein VNO80_11565 [Phaseolus coccineus]|uniref:Uncharacterized protein n=1 Tax=Phaseolus coccineus TaxID=3886 RepID=A0AAN9NAT6_PHACN
MLINVACFVAVKYFFVLSISLFIIPASSKTPATEPTTEAIRQATVNILRPIHLLLHFGIFCETYISTGKHTVRGQNPNAPITPTTSLKMEAT